MKRLFVTTLILVLTVSFAWAQQDRQQQDRDRQDRMQQNRMQQDRMQRSQTSPKARAFGYRYGMDGQCPCPIHDGQGMSMGMGMQQGMGGMGQMMGGMQGGMGQMGGMGGGQMGMLDFLDPMGFNTSLMMIYHSDVLNLTDQQVQELEEIYVQNQTESIDAWANLAKARLELNRAVMDDQTPEQEVTRAIDEVANAFADMMSTKYRQRQDVYSVLTPEQRQEYENFREMQFGQMDQMSGIGRMNGQMNGEMNGYHTENQNKQQENK